MPDNYDDDEPIPPDVDEDEDDEEGEDSYDDRVNHGLGDPPAADVHPFELDVDHEEVHIPPAIARRLAEAPVPAVRLKSKDAIAELERRGKPTQVLKEKVQAGYRSPWEGRPREGFTAQQSQRAVDVLSKEKAGQGAAGKLPGHTEQYHR